MWMVNCSIVLPEALDMPPEATTQTNGKMTCGFLSPKAWVSESISLILVLLPCVLDPQPVLTGCSGSGSKDRAPFLLQAGLGDRQVNTSLAQYTYAGVHVWAVCSLSISLGPLSTQNHLVVLRSVLAGEGSLRDWASRAQNSPDKAGILS